MFPRSVHNSVGWNCRVLAAVSSQCVRYVEKGEDSRAGD